MSIEKFKAINSGRPIFVRVEAIQSICFSDTSKSPVLSMDNGDRHILQDKMSDVLRTWAGKTWGQEEKEEE